MPRFAVFAFLVSAPRSRAEVLWRSVRGQTGSAPSHALLGEQGRDNLVPFVIERDSRYRPAGTTIPIRRVSGISFFTMQVSVYPGALFVVYVLSDAMCSVPVAFASCQSATSAGRSPAGGAEEMSVALSWARVMVTVSQGEERHIPHQA
jgi:hypothetical protein